MPGIGWFSMSRGRSLFLRAIAPAVAVVAALGLATVSRATDVISAPSTTEIISAFTDEFYPVLLPIFGVLAIIAVIFFIWRKVKGAAR